MNGVITKSLTSSSYEVFSLVKYFQKSDTKKLHSNFKKQKQILPFKIHFIIKIFK